MNTSSKSISWIELETDVLPHDLGRDQDDGGAVAIGLVEAVDEVEAARAAGAGAGREAAGDQRFGGCREGTGLFVPHVDPIDLAPVDGVGDSVQRVTDDPVARSYASGLEHLDYGIGHSFRHCGTSCRQFVASNPDLIPGRARPRYFCQNRYSPYPPDGGHAV